MSRDLELDQQPVGPLRGSLDKQASPSLQREMDAIMDLHPYPAMLTLGDLEGCIKLEDATFPEHQRCTREKVGNIPSPRYETGKSMTGQTPNLVKATTELTFPHQFIYRISTCGELCLGLFASANPDSKLQEAPTAAESTVVDSTAPKRKAILLAHVIATKTRNERIQDDDMKIPKPGTEDAQGHQEDGRTIAVHSLAVLPEHQKKGLGKLLLTAYIQRMADTGLADRISIITYKKLVAYYAKHFGFKDMGKSKAEFGGEEWVDMILDFDDWESRTAIADVADELR